MLEIWSSNLPKWHPKRVFFKVANKIIEAICSLCFDRFSFNNTTGEVSNDFSTTKEQSDLLLSYASTCSGAIVEVGSWEGETTRRLGLHSSVPVFAVDLYFEGWPLARNAYAKFRENTADVPNVNLIRKPSISAGNEYQGPPIELLFIDAQHNFLSTYGDFLAWQKHLTKDALIAFHDVDNRAFPGTRIAAKLISRHLRQEAHVHNLLIVRK